MSLRALTRRAGLSCVLAALGGQATFAEESDRLQVGHQLQGVAAGWPAELPAGRQSLWFELEYQPRASARLGRSVALVLEPVLRASAGHSGGDFRKQTDRQGLFIKEAYAARRGRWDVSAGWQIFSWGRADYVRPLDVFVAYDYSDRLREEPLGVPSLAASVGGDAWSLEGVVVPRSRLDRVSYDAGNVWSLAPSGAGTVEVDRAAAQAFEGGARWNWTGQAWEWSLIAARTLDRSPSWLEVLEPSTSGAERIRLRPQHCRRFLAGASAARPTGRFVLRVDAAISAYTGAPTPLAPRRLNVVLGAERRRTLSEGRGALTASVQYAFDDAPAALARGAFRVFRHAVIPYVVVDWRQRYRISARGLVDLESGGFVALLRAHYEATPGLRLWVAGEAVGGPSATTLGQFRHADRWLVGVALQRR